ncbi:MAG: acetylxylan esterase [Planctomycetes bacterium]|nr:acetylxylan esterase [Planctomycetota bacterium]
MSAHPIDRRSFLASTVGGWLAGPLAVAGRVVPSGGTAPAATAPTSTPAYDAQQNTLGLFDRTPREFEFKARTPGELAAWQQALRPRLRGVLGLTAMEQEIRFDHRAERAERVQKDGYTQEKWYLWTEPDVPLPIWVLLPDKPVARPQRLVLTPHGHNDPEVYIGVAKDDKARASIVEGQRDIAVQAARQGYLAVLPTSRGFGETRRADDRTAGQIKSCRTELMHAMLFGRTMIGYRVWDISRIIDWITRRHEVDPRCIAITGNSGGGTTSVFAPACDERISVAVPSCYFCTFRDSIGSIFHCECNYVPGLLRLGEMWDVAGLIAPRPFQAIAGRDDRIFPLAAVRKSHEQLRAIYRVAGAEDRCGLYVGDGGHRYYSDGAWPFIRKWFDPR